MTRSLRRRLVLDAIDSVWRLFGLSLLFLVVLDIALKIVFVSSDSNLVDAGDVDFLTIATAYGHSDWVAEFNREYDAKRVRPAPYVYWITAQQSGRYVNVNQEGLRLVRHHPTPGCTRPVRIFMFGGSTVFGYGARDDFTLPSALQRELEAKGECAEISNFGQDGYVSTQEMLLFQFALQHGNRPDIVIFYDGLNDAESALESADAGLTYNAADRAREFNLANPARLHDRVRLYETAAMSLANHSGLGIAARRTLQAVAPRTFQNLKGVLVRVGMSVPGGETQHASKIARDVVGVYLKNLAIIKGIALYSGIRCVFYWQPCLQTKRLLSQNESSLKSTIPPQEIWFVEQVYRDAAAMTSRDGVVDLAEVFGNSADPYYVDTYHLTEAANRVVAQAIMRDPAFRDALSAGRSERDAQQRNPFGGNGPEGEPAGRSQEKGALAADKPAIVGRASRAGPETRSLERCHLGHVL